MRSTQLSESLNSDLKCHLKSDLNLVDFFTHFERVVNSKRYNESKAEYDFIHKLPKLKMKRGPMLVQAGNIYTPKIFEEFQEEYEEHLGAYIKDHKQDQSMDTYIVANFNETKDRTVACNASNHFVYCNCRKFETHGILCSHALKVLDIMNIKLIPDHYILKLWTRDARVGRRDDGNGQHKEVDEKAHFTERYRELCPRIGNLVNRACESHEAYMFMSKVCEESNRVIEEILAKRPRVVDEEDTANCHVSISMTSDELNRVANTIDYSGAKGIKKRQCPYKGRSRPKTWLEKSNRKANANPKLRQKKTKGDSQIKYPEPKQFLAKRVAHLVSQQIPGCYVRDGIDNMSFTQLLTEPLFNNPEEFSNRDIMSSHSNQEIKLQAKGRHKFTTKELGNKQRKIRTFG